MENQNTDTTPTEINDIADVSVPKTRPIAKDTESVGHDATSTSWTPPTGASMGPKFNASSSTPSGSGSGTTPSTTTPATPVPGAPVPTPEKATPSA
jgi:hypothetical protein